VRRIHPETCITPSNGDSSCFENSNGASEKYYDVDFRAEWNRIKDLFLTQVERSILLSIHFDNGGPYGRPDYADTPLLGPATNVDGLDFEFVPSERTLSKPRLRTLNAGLGRIWSGGELIPATFRYPLQSNGQRVKSTTSAKFHFWTSAEDYGTTTTEHYVLNLVVKYHYLSQSGTVTLYDGAVQGYVHKEVSVTSAVIKDILKNAKDGGKVVFTATSASSGSWGDEINPLQIDDSFFEFEVDPVDAVAQVGVYGQKGHMTVANIGTYAKNLIIVLLSNACMRINFFSP
jgi:hypothetical protein